MSYKALYRKYRPHKFSDVVGQDHIVKTLENIVANQKISHAYLFSGPRGTGKTSLAHVFARAINATDSENASNQFQFSDDLGNSTNANLDIIEIDAASNNGVGEIRNIIDHAQYVPSFSKYKIYIIDEVHMLSKGAFNALLKTLEEPPTHVIFILATTEVHKIPVTILSRTQRFNFRRIGKLQILQHLKQVLEVENIQFDVDALKMIASLANGGLRDALSIVDQAAAFGNNSISFNIISQVFGIVSIDNQIELLNLAFEQKSHNLLRVATNLLDNGSDVERLTRSLLDILKEFIIFQKTNDLNLISYLSKEDLALINFSVDFSYRSLDPLIELLRDLYYTESPRQIFELTLLKLIENSSLVNVNEPQTKEAVSERSETVNEKSKSVHQLTSEELTQEITNLVVDVDTDLINLSLAESTNELPITSGQEQLSIEPENNLEITSQIDLNSLLSETTQHVQFKESKPESKDYFESSLTQDIDVDEFIENTLKIKTNDENWLDKLNDTSTKFMQKDIENMDYSRNVEEEILNTSEIELTQNTIIDSTSEIDVFSLFDENNSDQNSYSYSTEELLNILVQADRNLAKVYKEKYLEKSKTLDPKFDKYLIVLDKVNIISGGEEWILFSGEDEIAVSTVNNNRLDKDFILLTQKIFGKPILVYAITKDEFKEIKSIWGEYSSENKLPKPKPINKLAWVLDPEQEFKKYASSIFDDDLIEDKGDKDEY